MFTRFSTYVSVIITAVSISACGGGGDAAATQDQNGFSVASISGVYSNDQLPDSTRLVIGADGTYWHLGTDDINAPTVLTLGTGNIAVDKSGDFTANGTSYAMNSTGMVWYYLSVVGKADNTHLSFTSHAFEVNESSTATRIAPDINATGNIPSGTFKLSGAVFTPDGRVGNSASITVNGPDLRGSDGSCSFTGKIAGTKQGYANVSIRFANTTACYFPNSTFNGIMTFDMADKQIVYMLRSGNAPHTIMRGTSAAPSNSQ